MQRMLWMSLFVMMIFGALGVREYSRTPDGRLHIIFMDVGQGDSALILLPSGGSVLIDGGPDWSTLEGLGKRMPFFRRHLDLLALSHPNADHMMSFPEVLRRNRVDALVTGGTISTSGRYAATLDQAAAAGTKIVVLSAGESVDLGDGAILHVLWPPKQMPKGMDKDANNESLVLRLSYQGKSALFTGDIESIVEKTLVEAKTDLQADILKVPHHGSKTSSSTGFLLSVDPEIAVISVGKENAYGHPANQVIRRLEDIGATVRRTDEEGDIEIIW